MTTPTKEIERTYKVALDSTTNVTVRLRYTPGEEPSDRAGDTARHEAIKRAIKLRGKKGDNRIFDLDTVTVVCEQESFKDARPERPADLAGLKRKFGKDHDHHAESATMPARHGRNGWS